MQRSLNYLHDLADIHIVQSILSVKRICYILRHIRRLKALTKQLFAYESDFRLFERNSVFAFFCGKTGVMDLINVSA